MTNNAEYKRKSRDKQKQDGRERLEIQPPPRKKYHKVIKQFCANLESEQ